MWNGIFRMLLSLQHLWLQQNFTPTFTKKKTTRCSSFSAAASSEPFKYNRVEGFRDCVFQVVARPRLLDDEASEQGSASVDGINIWGGGQHKLMRSALFCQMSTGLSPGTPQLFIFWCLPILGLIPPPICLTLF